MPSQPSTHCIFCSRSLAEVGGARITASQNLGLSIRDVRSNAEAAKGGIIRAVSPDAESPAVEFWGNLWDEHSIERALAELRADRQPWLCQICGGRLCSECGSPNRWADGCDVVGDDGSVTHQMIVPTSKRCTNPTCSLYAPS